MRYIYTFLAYAATLVVVAGTSFFVVLVLAGPHAGLLPQGLEVVVLVLGWGAVLLLPFWVAGKVWRRLSPASHSV